MIEHPTEDTIVNLITTNQRLDPEEARTFAQAWPKAFCSRGPRAGRLKASCPAGDTPEAAIWQGLISNINPYKLSIGRVLWFRGELKRFFEVAEGIKLHPHMDGDRAALDLMGAW